MASLTRPPRAVKPRILAAYRCDSIRACAVIARDRRRPQGFFARPVYFSPHAVAVEWQPDGACAHEPFHLCTVAGDSASCSCGKRRCLHREGTRHLIERGLV
jgi:hypothetical protein